MPLCSAVAQRINLPYITHEYFYIRKKTCFRNRSCHYFTNLIFAVDGSTTFFDFVYIFKTCCPVQPDSFFF